MSLFYYLNNNDVVAENLIIQELAKNNLVLIDRNIRLIQQEKMIIRVLGNNEGNDNIADEADPTVGWISINKERVSQVPNEKQ